MALRTAAVRLYQRIRGSRPPAVLVLQDQPDLHEIPSETEPGERQYLYTYFRDLWPGGDVLEVGPFLGGTTRAIARGMQASPKEGVLHTCDRFQAYYQPGPLRELLEPLFASGALGPEEEDAVARGSFREVFDALHRDYADLLDVRGEPLPSTPEEEGEFLDLTGLTLSAIFVDGCKSWYSTRYLMERAAPAVNPGAQILFQDYGWYTCFWIPAFTWSMRDQLSLTAHVGSTYAFALQGSLDEVPDRFPDTPEAFGRDRFDEAYTTLVAEAKSRGDRRAAVVHELQHAAALAYIGDRDEAKRKIERLRKANRFRGVEPMIRDALRSPTYRPDGTRVVL